MADNEGSGHSTPEDDFPCAHKIIAATLRLSDEIPVTTYESAQEDQFQAAVIDLMGVMLHQPPTPEHLEAGVATARLVTVRLEAYRQRGEINDQAWNAVLSTLGAFLCAFSEEYATPKVSTAELESLLTGPVLGGAADAV